MTGEQKQGGRTVVWISDHWWVYADDPIAAMYTDDEGIARRVKFAKKDYADRHFTAGEIEALRILRQVYPDEVGDWWQKYDEIREKMIELFPRNEQLLGLLKPKQQETKQQAQPSQGVKGKQAEKPVEGREEKPADVRPTEGEEVPERLNSELAHGSDDDKFLLMEQMDERQIIEYMEGRLAQEFFYEFSVGGVNVVGISFAGTIWAAKVVSADRKRRGGGIEVLPDVSFVDMGDEWEAHVRAVDKSIDLTVLGIGSAMKEKWSEKKKRYEKDPFARRSAVSKASRNAIRQLIPEDEILNMYRQWKAGKMRKPPGKVVR